MGDFESSSLEEKNEFKMNKDLTDEKIRYPQP